MKENTSSSPVILTAKKESLKKSVKKDWQVYVMIAIPIAYLLIFHYYPMLGAQIAFKNYNAFDGIWGSPWIGFTNFVKFFKNYNFWLLIRNTLTISIYGLVAGFPMPIILALFLNAIRLKWYSKTVQIVTFVPHFISAVVLVGMLEQFFNTRTGIYGVISMNLFNTTPKEIWGGASVFPSLYVLSGVWQSMGWGSIIYFAALSGVDPELHEAAVVDGASRFQRILHIDIPSILPTIVILLILRVGDIMSVGFEKAFFMQNNLNLTTSELISTYVYKQGLVNMNFSYASAIGFFNSVINLILLVSVNTIANKMGETSLW